MVTQMRCRLVSGPDRLWHGTLVAPDLRDDQLPEDVCQGVVALLPLLASHESALVAWFATDSEARPPSLPEDGHIGDDSEGRIHYRFCPSDALGAQLLAAWRANWGLRVYPAAAPSAALDALEEQNGDMSGDRTLGLEPPPPSSSGILSLTRAVLHTARFVWRLSFASYRKTLLDPFQHAHWRLPVNRLGAYLEKGGHDDVGTVEFMTTSRPDPLRVRKALEAGGRRVSLEP